MNLCLLLLIALEGGVEYYAFRRQFRALYHLVLSSVMLVWQGLEECSMVKLQRSTLTGVLATFGEAILAFSLARAFGRAYSEQAIALVPLRERACLRLIAIKYT